MLAAHEPGGELETSALLGRLGDLGTIDARLDVAVSTACGALDNLVVETAEDAQRCVEFLKRHDVGRARFLILDKLQYFVYRFILIAEPSRPPWRRPSSLRPAPSGSSTG